MSPGAPVRPAGVMEEVAACALCGGRERTPFEDYRTAGETFPLVECAACGLAYLARRPREADMPAWYDLAYNARHGLYRDPAWRRPLYALLRELLRLRYEGGDAARLWVRRLAWPWERKWRRILATHRMERITRIGAVLDVGCGRGAWLAAMRRWGFRCHGVEPSAEACARARELGLDVACGQLWDAGYPDACFDVVRFNHVLEHLHDPGRALAEARRVLRPGGLLIVAVPNHAGIARQAFRQAEDVPFHLFAFTPPTLERFLTAAGLEVLELRTQTPHPFNVYAHFLSHARRMLAGAPPAMREGAEAFLSSENPARAREFAPLAAFFDSVGLGTDIVALCAPASPGARPAADGEAGVRILQPFPKEPSDAGSV